MSIGVLALAILTTAVSTLASDPPVATPGQSPAAASPTEVPKPGTVVRLSGNAKLQPERTKDGGYTLPGSPLRITAPLPDGYPAPTPPGEIELKTYPSVRRAEYTVAGEPGAAMFQSFRPLYNHISGRKIPMTSPVEMDFPPTASKPEKKDGAEQPPTWKISFLYRTKELGPTGTDGKVKIVDTAETTVVGIGIDNIVAGPETVVDEEAALRKWLSSQDQWEQAGDPRSLGYTGPGELPWSELQIPVRRKDAGAKAPAAQTPAPTPEQPAAPQGTK
ncbi:MAG: heme-binding protein [Phycisphaerales bacterium]|nr:heme-binding protein [Phycisphaerales bacterium]